ncbi:glycoside hydrolase family 19 protein [Rhodococcus sp. WS3]|uniref:glycoside hydrolase family 19 protein n=1 Tax=Rhodococcus sp. WS3 TaxID=2486271 RepID=UPI001C9DBD96|nr:glycoside hydrolase family 19 protein [Rhodococcus sp. WS3]
MGASMPMSHYEKLAPAFNSAMIQADCTTEFRAVMWCAQLGHESAGLRYMEEIADGSKYEWRSDLGNVQAGDGKRFKGRGPIQVTGRHNYSNLSQWAHGKGYVGTPTYFVDNPTELASPTYGFLGAIWYWTVARPQLNTLADQELLIAATTAINGGQHGIDDRRIRYWNCRAMGAEILPTFPQSGGSPVDIPALVNDQLSGRAGQGWPILGPSKVDPSRNNTLVEAVAEIRDALVTPRMSLVEPEYLGGNPPAELDVATYARTGDYQAFHAARQAEQAVAEVRALSAKFDLLLNALGGSK